MKQAELEPTKQGKNKMVQNGNIIFLDVEVGKVWGKWDSLGKVWGKIGESLGKVWGKFGESLGKVWGKAISIPVNFLIPK